MRECTRQWLEFLATKKNNGKAKEILEHIRKLESVKK